MYTAKDKKLTFRGGRQAMKCGDPSHARLCIYSDSDWAMGSVGKKSYSGNAIYFNGGLVAWFTHKQLVAAVSSTEVEYIAVSDACKDGLNMFHFLNEFMHVTKPISIYMDNQEAMYMASNLFTNKRSKYIDLGYHLIRDFGNKGIISLEYISTKHNIADIMTKPLQRLNHSYFTNMLLQDHKE